jgi:hypothetical protein
MGFDLNKWNVDKVILTDADGETATVLHKPVTLQWRAKYAEVLGAATDNATPPEADAESDEWVKWWGEVAKTSKGNSLALVEFARSLLDDLIVSTSGFEMNGSEPSKDSLLSQLGKIGPTHQPAAPLVLLAMEVLRNGRVSAEGNA